MPVRSVLKNVCGADRQSVTASLTFQVFNPIIISLFLSLSLSLSPLPPSVSLSLFPNSVSLVHPSLSRPLSALPCDDRGSRRPRACVSRARFLNDGAREDENKRSQRDRERERERERVRMPTSSLDPRRAAAVSRSRSRSGSLSRTYLGRVQLCDRPPRRPRGREAPPRPHSSTRTPPPSVEKSLDRVTHPCLFLYEKVSFPGSINFSRRVFEELTRSLVDSFFEGWLSRV